MVFKSHDYMIKGGFNSLKDRILDWSNLKAPDKTNVAQTIKCIFGRGENNLGKGENAGYQHFLLFMPHIERLGAYCFTVVCLSIRLSVCTNLTENLTFSHYS